MAQSDNLGKKSDKEKLVEDFKVLNKDVQELLKATATVVGEKASEARSKLEESLSAAQVKMSDVAADDTSKLGSKDKILNLLNRIPYSDSFEAAELAEQIAALVADLPDKSPSST